MDDVWPVFRHPAGKFPGISLCDGTLPSDSPCRRFSCEITCLTPVILREFARKNGLLGPSHVSAAGPTPLARVRRCPA